MWEKCGGRQKSYGDTRLSAEVAHMYSNPTSPFISIFIVERALDIDMDLKMEDFCMDERLQDIVA